MSRADRLFDLLRHLHDGRLHRAADLARALDVSVRTIYRDMDTLAASGISITGTRGTGYRLDDMVALPPLSLTAAEIDALNLGIAIVAESADPGLHTAATSLAAKIDAALPQSATAPSDAWKCAALPAASAARGFSHLPAIRSAINGRQKLRLTTADTSQTHTIRPLKLENWGRAWVLTAWSDTTHEFVQYRTDLVATAVPLPELFVDEQGKRLSDHTP